MKRNQQVSLQDDPEKGQSSNDVIEVEPSSSSRSHIKRRCFQVLSLSAFLASWVGNGEMLQGISNGLFGPVYDKPAALTWFSYNYMLLGISFVVPYVKCHRKWTLSFYIQHVWAGNFGLTQAILACAVISYTLQILNILYIVGLECIPFSLSNAIYQLQTIFTVGVSVCFLKDKFVLSEAVGIFVSVVGVAWIVLPPLLEEEPQQQPTTTCSFQSAPMFIGILATLGSAAIGGAYLVAWRVFDEKRHSASPLGRLEGLVDTQMTLAMIGLCNLVLGWPILPLAQWMGLEDLELPESWWMLHWNGMIEYAFDASCAVAIYTTSPVVVAIVSPLAIPLSMVADQLLYSTSTVKPGVSTWMGVIVILIGAVLMETKPDLTNCLWWRKQQSKGGLLKNEEKDKGWVVLNGAEKEV
jgi:drug/metabolite transporter (DMT)-like permease